MPRDEVDLLEVTHGSITAPAGCGKTELIARCLRRCSYDKPVLVLTHTNAGVAALRARLDKAVVPRKLYKLSTIDGFAMRLISTFPARSGHARELLDLRHPKRDYPTIRESAARLLAAGHIDEVIAASFTRLIVDEYQDCSIVQHECVAGISKVLPTCVLGDPLQAIFGFQGNELVDWEEHVAATFPPAGTLSTPWRWINAGEESFGKWLLEVRSHLFAGRAIDLRTGPTNVVWIRLDGTADHKARLKAGLTKPPTLDGSVLIIGDSTSPASQRQFASQTPGAVTVENVDLKDLVTFAGSLELSSSELLSHVVQFAASVMTNVGAEDLLARVKSISTGRARRAPSDVERAALALLEHPSYAGIVTLLVEIGKEGDVRTHRPAILRGCYKALRMCESNETLTAHDAAVRVREEARQLGRPLAKRTVGSTLLLKGLEADVVVVLNPTDMDRRHLYVALTRGSRKLVVCCQSPVLRAS